MKLGEIIDAFREEAGDVADPPLFGDKVLTRYANEAERQACRRARLIVDSSTAADAQTTPQPVCTYTVGVGDESLTLHPKILWVKRVNFVTLGRRIPRCAARDLDDQRPAWEAEGNGDVLVYLPDWTSGKLRWYMKPDTADTAKLTVIRLPLADMASVEDDSPEIRPEWHEHLADWMIWRAYARDDSETFDEKKAMRALARFTEVFGAESSAKDEEYMRTEYDFGGFDGVY